MPGAFPSADRIRAADLPQDFALSDSHDLMAQNGNRGYGVGSGGTAAAGQDVPVTPKGRKPLPPGFRDAVCRVLQPAFRFAMVWALIEA